MASNALSKRRGFKPRPDVCKSLPNPGRCHPPEPPEPPSPATCLLRKDADEPYYTGEGYTLIYEACHPDFGEELLLPPDLSALLGEIGDTEDIRNCGDGDNAEYDAPEEPGSEVLTLNVTWPDASTCQAILEFEVTEEDDNGDD